MRPHLRHAQEHSGHVQAERPLADRQPDGAAGDRAIADWRAGRASDDRGSRAGWIQSAASVTSYSTSSPRSPSAGYLVE